MAFMTVQSSGGGDGADRLPVLSYNAKAGRMFTLDRIQDTDGWKTVKADVTMSQPAFAVDFGSLEVGFAHFSKDSGPIFVMVPYGQPMPAKPPSPGGLNDNGKPVQFKQGFKVKVVGKAIGGARELAGNAGASIEGLNQLHNDYEAAPEAAAGKIPVVKMINVMGVRAGQSENFMPIYQIQQWVDRPEDLLGPRTVPAPSAAGKTTSKPASNHAAPPAAKAEPATAEEMPF